MTITLFPCESTVICGPCPDCPSQSCSLYTAPACASDQLRVVAVARPSDLAAAAYAVLGYMSGGSPTYVTMYSLADMFGAGNDGCVCLRTTPSAAPTLVTGADIYAVGSLPADASPISIAWYDVYSAHFRTYVIGGTCDPDVMSDATLEFVPYESVYRAVVAVASSCEATWSPGGPGTIYGLDSSSVYHDGPTHGTNLINTSVGEDCSSSTWNPVDTPSVTFVGDIYSRISDSVHPDWLCMEFEDTLSYSLTNSYGELSVELTVTKVAGQSYATIIGTALADTSVSPAQACEDDDGDAVDCNFWVADLGCPGYSPVPADSFQIPYPGGLHVCLWLYGGVTHGFGRTTASDPPNPCAFCFTGGDEGYFTSSYAVVHCHVNVMEPTW